MIGSGANLDVAARTAPRRFRDRADAGRILAEKLAAYRDEAPVVLAISGGAVPVAAQIASALGADLDMLVLQPIRTLATTPTLGLLVEGGIVALDAEPAIGRMRLDDVDHAVAVARRELVRRALRYRAGRPPPDVAGRTVILVDDGIATGRTMRAALSARRNLRAARIVIAVPVAPTLVAKGLRREVHEVVCAALEPALSSIADSYDDFHPLAEAEILGALARGRADVMAHANVVVTDVNVEASGLVLEGSLTHPRAARGIVVIPCVDARERHRARIMIRTLAEDSLAFLVVNYAGPAPRFADALDKMMVAPWAAGLPFGLLALGDAGRDLVTRAAAARALPSFCLADEAAREEVAVYFGACFGRGLTVV